VGLLALVAALLVCVPARSSAMMVLSSDFGDKDPCNTAGIGGAGGTLIKRNIGGSASEKPVNIMLQCSPEFVMPFGTLLAEDIARRNGQSPGFNPFRGDLGFGPSGSWLNTLFQPYIRGDIAEALRLQQFEAWPVIRNALVAAGVTLGSSLAVSAIVCGVGGIPTLGLSCLSIPGAIGAAAVQAIVTGAGAVITQFLNQQINRVKAMGDATWFVWSNTVVTWNSFGDITDTLINPSLTDLNPNPFHKDLVRIGVQWSNAPVGQGPEFFSAKEGGNGVASLPQQDYKVASRLQRVLRGGSGNETLIGNSHTAVIHGGTGNNLIMAGSGNETIYGGPHRDIIYAGRGNDIVHGGHGKNIIIGGAGSDILDGGAGQDWIIDVSGKAQIRTGGDSGPGRDFVYVRDGRGGDTVTCGSRRSTVVADANDVVTGCGKVIRSGRIIRLPSPRIPKF
jgi:Ca2+-binding RTX toxin-like protein